jgi:hypothetical protein
VAATAALLATAVVIGVIDPTASAPANPPRHGPGPGDEAAPGQVLFGVLACLVCAAFVTAGAVVAERRPRNPVGWLLCLVGASLALTLFADVLYWHLAFGREVSPPAAKWFAWIEGWSWIPAVVPLFGLVPLLFPTGAPPSRRWRPVGWAAAGGGVVLLLGTAFSPGSVEGFHWIQNPLGVDGLGLRALTGAAFAVCLAASIASAVSLVVRFRGSHGIERQQLRWVTAAGCLLVASFAGGGVLTSAVSEQAGWVCLLLGLTGIAAAIGVSMLRYRLYDLDVVINRALVYAVLTATLAASYLGTVLVLQLVVSPSSDLAVAASTLAAAALFRPARRRIQSGVDRRFYRRRYDTRLTLQSFATRMRDELELDALGEEVCAVVAETMQPAHVSLWVRPR